MPIKTRIETWLTSTRRRRIDQLAWCAIAAAVGLLHFLYHAGDLAYSDLPLDDAGTWGIARQSLLTNVTLPTEFHSQPPLYYIVLHFATQLSSEPWFLRGLSWTLVLAALQLILFKADELTRPARVFLCVLIIYSDITHYAATAVRPYSLALLLTLVSSVSFCRLLRDDRRRLAIGYAVSTAAMAYTMAFNVAVLLAQGMFALAACIFDARKGVTAAWSRRRNLVVAILAVIAAYVPYLLMALHYQYRQNSTKNIDLILTLAPYEQTFHAHLNFAPALELIVLLLCVLALVQATLSADAPQWVWPFIALCSIAFVFYFVTGRVSFGAQPKYMIAAFVGVSVIAALGFNLMVIPSKAFWIVACGFLVFACEAASDRFVAMRQNFPLQQFRVFHDSIKTQHGKKVVFFDVGYDGQHLEYAGRYDQDLEVASMKGSGWAAGGNDKISGEYILSTIGRRTDARCFYYYLEFPNGPYTSVFVPEMNRLGYREVVGPPLIYGHRIPTFCKS